MKNLSSLSTITAGVILFCIGIGIGTKDASAFSLFSRKTTQNARNMFGGDPKNLKSKTDSLQKGISTVRSNLNSKYAEIIKVATDSKLYSGGSTQVSTPLFIAIGLSSIASVLDILIKKFQIESEGLNTIGRSSTSGNAKEIEGIKKLKLSRDIGVLAAPLLCSIQADLALVGKVCREYGNLNMSAQGKILNIIQSLETTISSKTRTQLISLISSYKSEVNTVMNNAQNENIRAIYAENQKTAEIIDRIFNILVQFITSIKSYCSTGRVDEIVNFAIYQENQLAGGGNAMNM